MGYVLPALRNVTGQFYEQEVDVLVDGDCVWSQPSTFVVVAKSKYYGAGVQVVPDAELDDGFLHLAVYRQSRSGLTAMYAASFLGASPRPSLRAKGRAMKLLSRSGEVPVQVDGDYRGHASGVEFEVLPRAVAVLVGRV